VQRIGLYGGSFDPVHLGHLLVAGAALDELQLDRLLLIPAARSPFKPSQEPAPANLRVRMLRLAFAGWDRCVVDLQEIERGGVSYTVDTLQAVRERHPAAELFYLIGGDHLPALPRWREAQTLRRLAEFVAVPRPGQPVLSPPAGFRVRALRGFPLALSSSEVRQRVRAGQWQCLAPLVPPAVEEVIRNNALYL